MRLPSVTQLRVAAAIPVVFFCATLSLILPSQDISLVVSTAEAGQASYPDLVVTSLSNPNPTMNAGTAFGPSDTTGNIGDNTAAASTTQLYLSTDNTITTSDILVGSRSVGTLKKNSSSTGNGIITIPTTITLGTYYIGACADGPATITESNETNNCRASTTTMNVIAPLSFTATPSTLAAGDTVTVSWGVIANPTPGDWIGLYPVGGGPYVTWRYLNCSFSQPSTSTPSGSCNILIPISATPGNYEFKLWSNSQFVSNTFAVTAPVPPSISNLSPTSGASGTVVTINGSNFKATQGGSSVTLNGLSVSVTNWSDTAVTFSVPANASTGPVVVTVNGLASNSVTFTVTYSPRVNAGGSDYTDGGGKVWSADREYGAGPWGYVGGTPAYCGLCNIAGTTEDLLYQQTRYGNFSYKFDVPNGQYDVTLHLAETYWNQNGQRIFDVLIEGMLVLDDYDIRVEVGSSAAITKTYRAIQVSDGQLKLDFVPTPGAPDQNAIISAISIEPTSTKLAITSINGETNPTAGVGFPVIVQARNINGAPINLSTATTVNLSVKSGAGTLSGTTSGIIPAGSSQVTINGVVYSKADTGAILTAAATSEPPSSGDSSPFTVGTGSSTTLAFTIQPGNATTSGAITGPPTVAVRDSQGNMVTSSTAQITIAIGNNPSGGTLTGTTVKNASGGVATFADLKINQPDTGYTLTASAASLTGTTSNAFNVAGGGSVAGTVTKAVGGGAIAGALVEALQGGVVKGTASTNAAGSYTLTGLVAGSYDIRGTAGGFTPQTQSGVTVTTGATATANFSLSVATPTAGIVYIYDELQRLKSVIDPVGEAATYGYDAVGNLLSITRNNATQTSIIDFNPNGGAVGNTVTIHGTGYSATPGQNSVTFNGVGASVVSSSLTQIVTTVPAGATTGAIAVTSPTGMASSNSAFNVAGASGAPTIAGFNPTVGNVGAAVTITGTNFDSIPTNNEVHFNPIVAPVTTATSSSLAVIVPVGGRSGRISVSTPNGTVTSTQDFFVLPSAYAPGNVDFTGRFPVGGGSLLMTITNPDHIATAVFDAQKGQKFSLQTSNSTFPNPGGFAWPHYITIYKPDGSLLMNQTGIGSPDGFIDAFTAPMTGTYLLIFTPWSPNIGQATVTLNNLPQDNQGTIVIAGSPVNIVTTVPGQDVILTFEGQQDQLVNLTLSNSTFPNPGGFAWAMHVTITNPDGVTKLVNGQGFNSPTSTTGNLTLPATGTYTIHFNISFANTGQATVNLYNPPAINVTYEGKLRDRVGQGSSAVNPDGSLDGTFTVSLAAGSGNRIVTGLEMWRDCCAGGAWDTFPATGSWVVGAANSLDDSLFNDASGAVNFSVSASGTFYMFGADAGVFTSGAGFNFRVYFADGSTSYTHITLP